MKQFLLFGFNPYQAQGGWGDFINDYDSFNEAMAAADKNDWNSEFDIVNLETGEVYSGHYDDEECKIYWVITSKSKG